MVINQYIILKIQFGLLNGAMFIGNITLGKNKKIIEVLVEIDGKYITKRLCECIYYKYFSHAPIICWSS